MDIKNTFFGLIFVGLALYVMFTSSKQQQQRQDSQSYSQKTAAQEQAIPLGTPVIKAESEVAKLNKDDAKEELIRLENEYMCVTFTNKGAAIKNVELRKFKESQSSDAPYIFNDSSKTLALGLSFDTNEEGSPVLFEKSFKIIKSAQNLVIFEYTSEGSKITRAYSLGTPESKKFNPYLINTLTKVENTSGQNWGQKQVNVSLGLAVPNAGDVYGTNLSFGLYNGEKASFHDSRLFVSSKGFLGIGEHKAEHFLKVEEKNVIWGAVKNQFFATVFTPSITGDGGVVEPISIDPMAESTYMRNGLVGFMTFNFSGLEAGKTKELEGSYYIGPKELANLVDLGKDQELVMNFGWASFVSKPLLVLLTMINSVVEKVSPNWSWGWAIIILTIFVRVCLWPLTAVQIRSSLRMSKLQEPIAEIKKKFAGDQQKIGQETMKLYSEYGINPMAGCFPLLIQLPIFLGLYFMLQTSSGIRFAHFLWIQDLSLPDYIPGLETIFGFPLHPLPLINAFMTYIQMHLTPMPTAEKSQRMMMKLMPVVMLFFFYTFPSGLVLYWTVQSMIGILQAVIINRSRDKVVIKKRDTSKPTFMQRLATAAQEEAKRRETQRSEALKGTMHDSRKKNPGGRSTPTKRK